MEEFKTVDDVLDFAIASEEEAARFYNDLAGQMDRAWMAETFRNFANEEVGHKNKLMQVKAGKKLQPAADKVQDLKIGDYLVEMEYYPNMGYQDALVLAMQREKAAFKLYSDLAASSEDEGLQSTFLALAQEEAQAQTENRSGIRRTHSERELTGRARPCLGYKINVGLCLRHNPT